MDMAMANENHPQTAPPARTGSSYNSSMVTRITRTGTSWYRYRRTSEMLLFNVLTCYRSLFLILITLFVLKVILFSLQRSYNSIASFNARGTFLCFQYDPALARLHLFRNSRSPLWPDLWSANAQWLYLHCEPLTERWLRRNEKTNFLLVEGTRATTMDSALRSRISGSLADLSETRLVKFDVFWYVLRILCVMVLGNCKLAMTAIRLRNETITSDYASWHAIWVQAHSTLLQCVYPPDRIGGYHHTGTKARWLQIWNLLEADQTRVLSGTLSRLIVTLYAPDSVYDNQIKQIVKSHGEVCSREAIPEGAPARDPEETSGFTSCSSPIKLVLPESPLHCCNISTGRNQSAQHRNGTLCAPCGASPETHS